MSTEETKTRGQGKSGLNKSSKKVEEPAGQLVSRKLYKEAKKRVEADMKLPMRPLNPLGGPITQERKDVLLQRVKDSVMIAMFEAAGTGNTEIDGGVVTNDCNAAEIRYAEGLFCEMMTAMAEEFGGVESFSIGEQ